MVVSDPAWTVQRTHLFEVCSLGFDQQLHALQPQVVALGQLDDLRANTCTKIIMTKFVTVCVRYTALLGAQHAIYMLGTV